MHYYIFEKSSHLFKNRKNDFKKFINILENSSFFINQANMIMKLGLKHIYDLNSFINYPHDCKWVFSENEAKIFIFKG